LQRGEGGLVELHRGVDEEPACRQADHGHSAGHGSTLHEALDRPDVRSDRREGTMLDGLEEGHRDAHSPERCSQRKLSTSACSSTSRLTGVPAPWPARVSTRRSTGDSPCWACWSAAANLKEWAGTTRSSWSPV